MITIIVIVILSALVLGLSYTCLRLTQKLFQFDELFELFVDEIDININYFDKLLQLPLFLNSPEIEEANRNMRIMKARLEEFTVRMGETRGREKERPKDLPRPVAE